MRRLRKLVPTSKLNDHGSTLVPVVVLTGVGLLVVAILGNIIISSLDFTSRSSATIQAEVAAEAGLALGAKEISNCQSGSARFNISQPQPNVTVQIRYFPKGSTELNMASGVAACPPKGAFIFKVVSTGFSSIPSGTLSSSPFSIRMEEVFDYAVSGPYESGPAGIFGGSNAFLAIPPILSGGAGNAPLVFANGFSCPTAPQSSMVIPNDVVVLEGVLKINTGCTIAGNVYSKNANTGSAVVTVKPLTDPALPTPSSQSWVPLYNDPNIWTDAGFERIISISNNTASPGNSDYFYDSGICGNSLTQLSQILSPAFPVGYPDVATEPIPDTVVDGFGGTKCGSTGIRGVLDLNLQGDVVILAERFRLDTLKIRSKDNQVHRVWLVVPMTSADAPNPCPGIDANASNSDYTTERISVLDFDIDITKIKISLYTTGYLELGNPRNVETLFRGQLFACNFKTGLQVGKFIYDPSGLPGYNLDTGEVVVDGNYPRRALLKFKRDVSQ